MTLPLRVLMLDPNTSAVTAAERPRYFQHAFWTRLGGLVEYANTTTPTSSTIWSTTYDIIVVPWMRNVAASYTNLQTYLARFTGAQAGIPCYVAGAREPSLASSVSGCSAMSATGTDGNYASTGIKNWGGRLSNKITWLATPPTLAGQSGVTNHSDDGTHSFMWSNTVSGHPVLWQAGITGFVPSGIGATYKFWRPWYAAQWMVDLDSSKLSRCNTMYLLLRADGYDNFTQTLLDSIYTSALAYGVTELWLAATWTGSLGSVSATQEAWWLARQQSNGGIVRAIQHFTDLVDGTTGGAASTLSTDGNAFDQYATADTTYKGHCDQMTAKGWVLGTDGYGRGTINVQNGNSMNNAVAHYVAARGMNIWLLLNGTAGTAKLYPDLPAAAQPGQTNRNYPAPWNGAWPVYSWSLDSYTAGGSFMSRSWPSAISEGLIFGGGPYVHQSGLSAFDSNKDEIFDIFSTCRDIVKSGPLSSAIAAQKKGPGMYVLV